jgi:colanic acid biosynthesis glycosyl transferase WcaI
MRILIISLYFSPDLISTSKYSGELAVYLALHGHEVHVVTAPPYYPQWKIRPGYSGWRYHREKAGGVTTYRCPLWVPKRPTGFGRLLHLFSFSISCLPVVLRQTRWKPDVILCILPTLFSASNAILAGRMCGAKTWLHIQDFELDAAFGLEMLHGIGIFYPLARRYERSVLTHFDRVSTISMKMLTGCIEKGVRPERTWLFPNWVNTASIRPLADTDRCRRGWGIDPKKVVVLYHGNMGRKQGLKILIEVASRLQKRTDLLFLLCGEGPVRKELEAQARGLSNVRFLDLQPEEKLNELVNLADIHILPQRAGVADLVMPSKLSTMLASGRAVIATADEATELGQVIKKTGLLVPPEDASALQEAICDLANDPKQRARLGALGRQFAIQNWDGEKVLSSFNQQLSQLSSKSQAV